MTDNEQIDKIVEIIKHIEIGDDYELCDVLRYKIMRDIAEALFYSGFTQDESEVNKRLEENNELMRQRDNWANRCINTEIANEKLKQELHETKTQLTYTKSLVTELGAKFINEEK